MDWFTELFNPLLYGYARCMEDASPKDKFGEPLNRDKDGVWRYADGRPASTEDANRLKSMKPIPPAYKDTRLSLDQNQNRAVSTNPNNPKKPLVHHYSKEDSDQAKIDQHLRGDQYNKDKPKIDKKIAQDLKSSHLPTKEAAAVLNLINKTGFRVGSNTDTGAKQQAYGASTLQANHVNIDGDKVHFNFIGKKGVEQSKIVHDTNLARDLKDRIGKAGTGGKLFNTSDDKVRAHMDKISDGKYTPKDMRTWQATSLARSEIEKMPKPKSDKEFKAAQKAVASTVASHLGNTPAVAMNSYINPRVWDAWK